MQRRMYLVIVEIRKHIFLKPKARSQVLDVSDHGEDVANMNMWIVMMLTHLNVTETK